eukprot:9167341-Alexandrium_andersonii.AAC.1
MGARRGSELWHHLRAQYNGMGPELSHRAVAELPTPDRTTSVVASQPALLRPKEQLRDIESTGHPIDDTQRAL